MKILWFASTPSLYNQNNHVYNGGGWVESLERIVSKEKGIELAIAFLYHQKKEKVQINKTLYYPVYVGKRNIISKLVNNWFCKIDRKRYTDNALKIIDDFKPDLIHIFGTEGVFPRIQGKTNLPIVIQLQGLINPCLNAFFPPAYSKLIPIFSREYIINNILGNSPFFQYRIMEKQAIREKEYFRNAHFLMGRTSWDKAVSAILAPKAVYFHVEEPLRPAFYNVNYQKKRDSKLFLVSTLSATIYKGFDLLLKTAKLLSEQTAIEFEWQIIGLKKSDKLVKFFEQATGIKHQNVGIKLVGVKNSIELIDIVCKSDLFIHPAYIDNSPNSICEAQIIGIPVVACDVGGVSSLVKNGITGSLVPANDPYSLAFEIDNFDKNSKRYFEMSIKAREKAYLRHNHDVLLSQLLLVYKQILS
jgi:glycosyltransferase involved in cell wall biosynthesis